MITFERHLRDINFNLNLNAQYTTVTLMTLKISLCRCPISNPIWSFLKPNIPSLWLKIWEAVSGNLQKENVLFDSKIFQRIVHQYWQFGMFDQQQISIKAGLLNQNNRSILCFRSSQDALWEKTNHKCASDNS